MSEEATIDNGHVPTKPEDVAPRGNGPVVKGEGAKDDVKAEADKCPTPPPPPPPPPHFSWLDPHPIFVIVLVGTEERPFGIQKDFLCSKSIHYRRYFAEIDAAESLEHVVRLPDTPAQVFSYAQNFLFTGHVFPDVDNMPAYEVLIGVWKLGHELGIEGLCDATLDAMIECRRITQEIPATPLLVQVWQDTPRGSSIRHLLLAWAAEYIRSSTTPNDFVDTLPKEILSELVVAMRSDTSPPAMSASSTTPSGQANRSVHYLEEAEDGASRKKQRHSDIFANGSAASSSRSLGGVRKSIGAKPVIVPTTNRGGAAVGGRRRSGVHASDQNYNTAQKLEFCSDLLTRMLSGPGFWTRLVGPFKTPVDPVRDGVPDYFDKVDKPMDLGTMKGKMDRQEYADDEAFLADMNQIFQNCFTYWKKGDPMWAACEKLQKTFQEKYSQMNKWIAKMDGEEGN